MRLVHIQRECHWSWPELTLRPPSFWSKLAVTRIKGRIALIRADCQHRSDVTEPHTSIQSRLMALRQEHRDLDQAIAHLVDTPSMDQLQLRRMKKRKLRLRDQIAYWESKLIPDLDA